METGAYVVLFFLLWGFISFLLSSIRFVYRIATSEKRRAENERNYKSLAEEGEENQRIREDNKKKDLRIKELEDHICAIEDTISRLQAAAAPLPDLLHGGELAYDYRDVTIYVPDENFDKIVLGNPLFVSRSRYNRYDKDAVSLNYRGEELALLCRGKMQEMALDYLSRGDRGYAIISHVDFETKTVKVHIGFYKGCDISDDLSDDNDSDFENDE